MSQIPVIVTSLYITVNVYTSGASFSNVYDAYVRLVDTSGTHGTSAFVYPTQFGPGGVAGIEWVGGVMCRLGLVTRGLPSLDLFSPTHPPPYFDFQR